MHTWVQGHELTAQQYQNLVYKKKKARKEGCFPESGSTAILTGILDF